jgi:hypothetical protein
MDNSVTIKGAFGWLTGLVVCAIIAFLTGRLLSHDAGWLVLFAPSALVGFHCLAHLLRAFGVPVAALGHGRSGEPNDFGPPRRHPNEGLVNPTTGLFIGGSGCDALGNGFGMGSRDTR